MMSSSSSSWVSTASLETAKVLMVGAGGIGCELLKTLVLTGFQHIHVIDMDTIEVSNLNRQFLFRKRHVGQSKAKVAREAMLKLRPDLDIVAHHANVKSPEFDVFFFQEFSFVLNGLDNLDARRHVNRLCLAANVPLVESGTTGYLGQVTVHVRGHTECYECQTKPTPKSYPVCTITNTPSKPVHCIVWAKDLAFAKLFGDKTQANDLDVRVKDDQSLEQSESQFYEISEGETSHAYAARVFDRLFGHNVVVALQNEDAWKDRRKPFPLFLADIFGDQEEDAEDEGTEEDLVAHKTGVVSAMAVFGLKNPQELWSLKTNARIFAETVRLFLERRKEEVGKLTFDKDDLLAVEFVTAASNLRAWSFGIPLQSLFDAKGIAGNIVHAIATTNAIIAGLIVLESLKLLNNDISACKMTYCVEHPTRKLLLMPVDPFEKNPLCYVCSKTPLLLEVNTETTTLREVVDKIIKRQLGASLPIIMHNLDVIYETGGDLEKDMVIQYEKNLDKRLASFAIPIVTGSVLTVEDFQQEFTVSLTVKHREEFLEDEVDGMVLVGLGSGIALPESNEDVDNNVNSSSKPTKPVGMKDNDVEDLISMSPPESTGFKSKIEKGALHQMVEAESDDEMSILSSPKVVGVKRKAELLEDNELQKKTKVQDDISLS